MTITTINQQPVVLDPTHVIPIHDEYDPIAALHETVIDPLLRPVSPGTPVRVLRDRHQDVTDDVPELITSCLHDEIDPAAEMTTKQLLGQTMTHFDVGTTLPVQEMFVCQTATKHGLPEPSQAMYTARSDVIPAAKAMLDGSGTAEMFLASLAMTYHLNTLGFWFTDAEAFTRFGQWVSQQTQHIQQHLSTITQNMLSQVADMSLDGLAQSLLLRRNDSERNEEYSFARVLIHMLMEYAKQHPDEVGPLPFTVGELFCPRSVVLANVTTHAQAQPTEVNDEWRTIERALASPIKILSSTEISKLTALPRATSRATAQAAASAHKLEEDLQSSRLTLRGRPPSPIDLTKDIARELRRMGRVNRSQNVLRTSRPSFLRANRRDPDDVNRPGRIIQNEYMPDLHLFLDHSASISEENLQGSVMIAIHIAQKLEVNLYFNSFSHILSQETLLRTKNKSPQQVWREYRRVPKVDGSTDYMQIWRYVQASPTRRRRLSLMVTDFEWTPPSVRLDHPRNLFYVPCSRINWSLISNNAQEYVESMGHIEPHIDKRLIGMAV